MSKKNNTKGQAMTPNNLDLPEEARWRLEGAALKARPLCDALALLEDAIYGTIDDAYWAVTYGEATPEQYLAAAYFYLADGMESARHRLEQSDRGYDGVPEEVDKLVKAAVKLLTNRK